MYQIKENSINLIGAATKRAIDGGVEGSWSLRVGLEFEVLEREGERGFRKRDGEETIRGLSMGTNNKSVRNIYMYIISYDFLVLFSGLFIIRGAKRNTSLLRYARKRRDG